MQLQAMHATQKKSVFSKQKLLEFGKYMLTLLLLIVTSYATINFGNLTPFAIGMYFSLLILSLNPYIISVQFLFSFTLSGFSLVSVYTALGAVFFGLALSLIYKKSSAKPNRYVVLLFCLLANVAYAYFNVTSIESAFQTAVAISLSLLFCFAAIHFFQATIGKGFNFALNLDEAIAGSLVLVVLSMGIASINFQYLELIKVFAVVAILICTYIFPKHAPLFVATVVGLGASLHTMDLTFVATFNLFALISIAFKNNNKIFACLAILLCEVVLGLYFNVYTNFSLFSIISVVVAQIVFMLLPTKFINNIGDLLGGIKEKVAVRNIVNHTKEGVFNRMNEIAIVFNEMESVFRTMVKGGLPTEDAKKMLVAEAIEKVCKNSDEINRLLRVDSKTTMEVFTNLVSVGFERGKITLLDVPQYITSRIGRVNLLINTINQLLASYKHYNLMVSNMDTSRLLIADQLGGVGVILRNLAEEVKTNISFDQTKERVIIEDLSYKNIMCVEAIVYEQNAHIINVTLVLKENHYKKQVVEKVVSKVVGSQVGVINESPSTISGCTIVTLKTKAQHDIVFGSASAGKSGEMVSGDTHSLIKIDDGRFMVALCDGMGSGKIAHQTSGLAISLIENFYKAGFENEMILNSVNKLLVQSSEENFSALDVCVIDVRKGIMDFIKLGSPKGYIKQKNTTEVVEAGGLPMGVLEEMRPHIAKKVIINFDIVVMVSDGISDSFEKNGVNLQEYINNLQTTNPQSISDEVLDKAVDLNKGICPDDMTVVAVRIFPLQ